ncbi:phytoene/squalene synthase family protein [Afifella sp. IM 167]|uniref:phytoene/squalene synthase family protein n=1 Tax=Afifella sp. IM 167 TaxID=2033586 RepID=UPI001CCBC8E4|nr:phytoene/squalene synthase family protein [Afifella sp. IM 167]MBZ8132196.1 phytoene synthase [Afifella sp. IM 167]
MQPLLPDAPLATPADHAACRELIRTGSRTFFAASMLLPPQVREPAYALYGFCRLSDDAVDLSGGDIGALHRLRQRLDDAYACRPAPIAADRAFAEIVLRYGIPRSIPDALLEGFAWDVEGRRYETLSDLHAYAARVAGTVGAMMAMLMGECGHPVIARACDLGVAMQLTNICRDVGEDARNGRIYLPLQWMREAGIDPDEWLRRPEFSEELGGVIGRVLGEADQLYARATSGIARLPWNCRPAIHAACRLYAEIGRELERRGLDSVSQRAVVPASRKAWLLARTSATRLSCSKGLTFAPLPETRFLVDAAVAAAESPYLRRQVRRRGVSEHTEWVIDLFADLSQREAGARLRT